MKLTLSHVKKIKEKAISLGFADCGFTKLRPFDNEKRQFLKWISANKNGDMTFLEKNIEKRFDPQLLDNNFKSAIVVLLNYHQEISNNNSSLRISKYALGKDYHIVLKEKLSALEQYISENISPLKARSFVDSAPIYESQLAVYSGLGWKGKNTLVINQKLGSFFFIGELLSDLEFPNMPIKPVSNHCGTCTRCLDACPTKALNPYQIDATKCISYLTIERKSLSAPQHNTSSWIYGCDICQEVCPWNQKKSKILEKEFFPNPFLLSATLNDWENLSESEFKTIFKTSPILRTGYKRMLRNVHHVRSYQ